jgi:MOSC domain-containing protein YiiM
MSENVSVTIHRILISPEHIYRGHHGREPGTKSMVDRDEVACEAGRGLTGDRYQREKIGHKRQVTFFELDVHRDLLRRFPGSEVETDVYRRNVVIDGVDLNGLIGKQFRLGGVLFEGVEECRPCYWMDTAFGPGAEEALKGRGGLRARILKSGTIRKGPQKLIVDPDG